MIPAGNRWKTIPARAVACTALVSISFCTGCDTDIFGSEPCPKDISLSTNSISIKQGRTAQLSVAGGREECHVYWENDDYQVVRINSSNTGVSIEARNLGQTYIHAYRGWTDEGPVASCLITVVPATLTSMTLSPDSLTVVAGSAAVKRLEASFTDDAGYRVTIETGLEWISLDPSIASVYWTNAQFAHIRGYQTGSVRVMASYRGPGTNGQTLNATAVVEVIPVQEIVEAYK